MYNPKETEKDYLITRGTYAIFALIICSFFCYGTADQGISYGLVKLKPVVGTATVTKVKRFEDNHTAYAHYSYAGKSTSEVFSGQYLHQQSQYGYDIKVNDTVGITYFKYRPSHHFITEREALYKPEYYIFILFASVSTLLVAFIVWNTYCYQKFKKKMKRY